MTAHLDDALQDCLTRIEAGGEPAAALARYPELRPELDDLLFTAVTLRGFAPPPVPDVYRSRIREAIEGLAPRPQPQPSLVLPALLTAALLVGAGLIALRLSGSGRWAGQVGTPAPPHAPTLVLRSPGAGPAARALDARAQGRPPGAVDPNANLAGAEGRVNPAVASRIPGSAVLRAPRTTPRSAVAAALQSGPGSATTPSAAPANTASPSTTATRAIERGEPAQPGKATVIKPTPEPAIPTPTGPPPAIPAEPAGIAGRVIDLGGLPLPGAAVRAEAEGGVPAYFVSADAQGDYFVETGPGSFRVHAEHPDHAGQWYPGVADPGAAALVTVVEGRTTSGIDFRLPNVSPTPQTATVMPSASPGGTRAGPSGTPTDPIGTPAPPSKVGASSIEMAVRMGPTGNKRGRPPRPQQELTPTPGVPAELLRVSLPDFRPPEPLDIVLSPAGLFVADALSHAVILYDAAGNVIRSHTVDPARYGCALMVPVALERDPENERLAVVWACYSSRIEQLDSAPSLLIEWMAADGSPGALQALDPANGLPDLAWHPQLGAVMINPAGRLSQPAGRVERTVVDLPSSPHAVLRIAALTDGRIAAAYPAERRVRIFTLSGAESPGPDVAAFVPLALAAAPDGGMHVLVRPAARGPTPLVDRDGRQDHANVSATHRQALADQADPAAPLLLTFDREFQLVGSMSAADLGTAHPEAADWPWAISALGTTVALVTGDRRFEIVTRDATGSTIRTVFGAAPQSSFRPADAPLPDSEPASPSIDIGRDGRVLVVDDISGRLTEVEADGSLRPLGGVPGAYDLAVAEDGAVFLLTDAGRLVRLPDANSRNPTWDLPCGCSRESRLALDGDTVLVGRPRAGELAAYDAATGAARDVTRRPEWLWPSDAGGGPAGTGLAAHLLGATIHPAGTGTLPAGAAAGSAWRSGLALGPRRLDVSPDGLLGAAITGDGYVEVHALRTGTVLHRWRPTVEGGALLAASDIAVHPSGRIYLADGVRRSVAIYQPGDDPAPSGAEPVTADQGVCEVSANRLSSADVVAPGSVVTITLSLSADCPGPAPLPAADILFLVDTSGSMAGAPLRQARAAVARFVEMAARPGARVGLATFAMTATVAANLGEDPRPVLAALDSISASGPTDLAGAVDSAARFLAIGSHSAALPALVIVSDGESPQPAAEGMIRRVRSRGIAVYGLAAGGAEATLRMRAILRDAPRTAEAGPAGPHTVYRQLVDDRIRGWARDLTLSEPAPGPAAWIPGTWDPQPLQRPAELLWYADVLPAGGLTVTYAITLPAVVQGPVTVGEGAAAEYTDADGVRRRLPLPTVQVDVPAPTATATPTASSTSTASPTATTTPTPTASITPTPEPAKAYLPITFRNLCPYDRLHVVLIVPLEPQGRRDGSRLAERLAAAKAFLARYDLAQHSAAIVGFDRQAALVASGRDSRGLDRALDGLAPRPGARWDLALRAAATDLAAATADGRVQGAIVLFDGPDPDPAVRSAARTEAERLTAAGIRIHAVSKGRREFFDALAAQVAAPLPGEDLSTAADGLAGGMRVCGDP